MVRRNAVSLRKLSLVSEEANRNLRLRSRCRPGRLAARSSPPSLQSWALSGPNGGDLGGDLGAIGREKSFTDALAEFCEPCKKCQRRKAFFEKSDNRRQRLRASSPDVPHPGGSAPIRRPGCAATVCAPRHSRVGGADGRCALLSNTPPMCNFWRMMILLADGGRPCAPA